MDILRTLRLHYGILESDQKHYDQIEQQINQFESYWIMERKTEGFYAELVTRYVRNKSQKEEISSKASAYFQEVKPYMGQCESKFLNRHQGRACKRRTLRCAMRIPPEGYAAPLSKTLQVSC